MTLQRVSVNPGRNQLWFRGTTAFQGVKGKSILGSKAHICTEQSRNYKACVSNMLIFLTLLSMATAQYKQALYQLSYIPDTSLLISSVQPNHFKWQII